MREVVVDLGEVDARQQRQEPDGDDARTAAGGSGRSDQRPSQLQAAVICDAGLERARGRSPLRSRPTLYSIAVIVSSVRVSSRSLVITRSSTVQMPSTRSSAARRSAFSRSLRRLKTSRLDDDEVVLADELTTRGIVRPRILGARLEPPRRVARAVGRRPRRVRRRERVGVVRDVAAADVLVAQVAADEALLLLLAPAMRRTRPSAGR